MKNIAFKGSAKIAVAIMLLVSLVCLAGVCVTAAEEQTGLEIGQYNLEYNKNTHIIVTLVGEAPAGQEKGIAVWDYTVEGELTLANASFLNFEVETDSKGVEYYATQGIPAAALSEEYTIAPVTKDAEGNVAIAGALVKRSAFGYVAERLGDEGLMGYQVDLYRDLVVYGTSAEQVLGDKVANKNVVVAKGGYVGAKLLPVVIADTETEIIRALAVNAKGEYFSHWEDAFGNFVTGERIATVDVKAGVNYYNAVYTDKADSAYSYFANFQSFALGEYDYTVGDLTDAEKTAGKVSKILPLLPNKDGTLLGFRKMMVYDAAAFEGLSATDKIPTTASDSLSIVGNYDGTKYLNYVKDATASYGYAVGSVFDTSSAADQLLYDRFEMDVSIPRAASLPTIYLRFISSAGATADIILNIGRYTVDGVACFRVIYQTASGNRSLFVPDNGGTDVVSIGVDIDADGVCSIYLNGEKAALDAPIARLSGSSYVAIPAGTYNPVRFQLENSSGFNYNYEIYSIGLVDTDKTKTN